MTKKLIPTFNGCKTGEPGGSLKIISGTSGAAVTKV
jgi:hypothetical protein